jgi:hypothetical protein
VLTEEPDASNRDGNCACIVWFIISANSVGKLSFNFRYVQLLGVCGSSWFVPIAISDDVFVRTKLL